MNVTTVSASVRYSKPMGDGSFKTVELSAEASLTPQEAAQWQDAQASLYSELGQQLKSLWSANGNGSTSPTATTTPAHYCQTHQTEFRRYEKEGRTWYAHKSGKEWCREAAK